MLAWVLSLSFCLKQKKKKKYYRRIQIIFNLLIKYKIIIDKKQIFPLFLFIYSQTEMKLIRLNNMIMLLSVFIDSIVHFRKASTAIEYLLYVYHIYYPIKIITF